MQYWVWGNSVPHTGVVGGGRVLTLSRGMKASSVCYYADTARAVTAAAMDRQAAGGGLGEYYSEHETRAPVWLVAGNPDAAELAGLSARDLTREADLEVVMRWLDEGVAPSGVCGRGFTERSVRGFDLTFCAPKSVSVMRALDAGGVVSKAVLEAHTRAMSEAMTYLHRHAGYTRVHNAVTGMKDLQRLPGFVAAAFQHETSRAGDPHLHTHVLLPRQVRADGAVVSYDSKSLHHEAKAAGMLYQATLRAELAGSLGVEWARVDPHTGMAEVAGVSRKAIAEWSQRSTQLREWAAGNLAVVEEDLTAGQLAAAQRATRPRKPENRPWRELKAGWVADPRGFSVDEAAQLEARRERVAAGRTLSDAVGEAAAGIGKAAFTRADLVEAITARLPVVVDALPGVSPRTIVEDLVGRVGVRVTEARQPHEREGHERFTTTEILDEERAIYELMGTRDSRSVLPGLDIATLTVGSGLSGDQVAALRAIAASPVLVQTLAAPAGAGKTTSLAALRKAAAGAGVRVLLAAPTGKAADVAMAEGAADAGYTVEAMLGALRAGRLTFDSRMLLVVDEAGMVGTPKLRELLTAATAGGAKTLLVGDAEQLAPVAARGGMFARLCADLPWAQDLTEVWRMRDPAERDASLALRARGNNDDLERAVAWYRDHDRLHIGDPVTMADDALTAWTADRAAGVDALLIADRWETADALNERIHRQVVGPDAATITAARQHTIGIGDTVITRRNDPAITVYDSQGRHPVEGAQVRNGQRWQVINLDAAEDRIAVSRIGDGLRAILEGEYLHQHVHHGYAVTVHAAQGNTADRCHAILSPDTGNRAGAYVAMTRGRDTNQVYLYEQVGGEGEHEHGDLELAAGVHVARRGDARDAAEALRRMLGRDTRPETVIDAVAGTRREGLPDTVVALLEVHDRAVAAARQVHDRAVAAARLADDLDTEVGWLARIARRSYVIGYPPSVMESLDRSGLHPDQREAAHRVLGYPFAVQPLHVGDRRTTTAMLAALTDAARAVGMPALIIGATPAAAEEAQRYSPGDARSPRAALSDVDAGRLQMPAGTLIVVDDADHLEPEELRRITTGAFGAYAKIVLVTTEGPAADRGPSWQLTAAAAHLPAAQVVGVRSPAETTAITRSRHSNDPHITELRRRAEKLLGDRHRSRDNGYDLSL